MLYLELMHLKSLNIFFTAKLTSTQFPIVLRYTQDGDFMRVIYLDVLFITNLYTSYFLLAGCAAFLHTKVSRFRLIWGSGAGGLASLFILLPELNFFLSLFIKLTISIVLVLITFGKADKKTFIKYFITFFSMNIIYAGLMLIICCLCAPLGMVNNNGFTYINISLGVIFFSTTVSYTFLRIVRYYFDRKGIFEEKYDLCIKKNGIAINLTGYADSGNTLCDFFTGLPVIICDQQKITSFFSYDISHLKKFDDSEKMKEFRLIPYTTISESGMVYAFHADQILISNSTHKKSIDALVGFVPESTEKKEYEAVFNPRILL